MVRFWQILKETLSKMDRIIYQKKTKITLITREANIIFLAARA